MKEKDTLLSVRNASHQKLLTELEAVVVCQVNKTKRHVAQSLFHYVNYWMISFLKNTFTLLGMLTSIFLLNFIVNKNQAVEQVT